MIAGTHGKTTTTSLAGWLLTAAGADPRCWSAASPAISAPTARVTGGCILLLEDIGERPYRIRRMLTQLEQSGMLARAGALVFGEFPGCDGPGGDPAIRDVLRDFTATFNGPVLFGFPSGHTTGPTWTLPLGVAARAVGGVSPALVITEAVVS